MRLVISGYYGFGNTGDEAVLAGLLKLLYEAGVERRDVTVLSADVDQTRRVHDVPAASRWNPARVALEIRRSGGLISGGGGLLQDATSPRPVVYYAGVMQLARVLHRPYAVLAHGLGPLRRTVNRRIAASVLNHAAHVSFRDDRSIALARRIGVRREIHRTADPALASVDERRGATGGSHVLVALRGGFGADAVIGQLREVVTELARDRRVVALPMDATMDTDASAAVVSGIPGASLVDPGAPLDAKAEAIGAASVVIGVRLHALVLAAAAGVPAVAISYDPKVDSFAERAGITVAGSTTSMPDRERVLSAVRLALGQEREPYLARVADMRAEARADVEAALRAITLRRARPHEGPGR